MADVETNAEGKRTRRSARQRKAELEQSAAVDSIDTPDPIELAMRAVASGTDQHPAVRAVLERHAQLIEVQCRREAEELALLRLQRMTRFAWLSAGIAVLAGAGSILWSAANSNSLVVEPFEVPPALAARGLNGKVISARVLDRLAELQRETESMRGEKSYANAWSEDIKLDIPQTGVSVAEAWRTLKGWLGNETRIAGEVVQTPTGIAITTRAGGLSGGTVAGTEAEIDRLITEAARGVYRVTQPYRFAITLGDDKAGDRFAILQELTRHPSAMERKWAYSGLSRSYRTAGDDRSARDMALKALAIDPNLLPAIGNLGMAELNLGHDEQKVAASARWWHSRGGRLGSEYDPRISEMNRIYQDSDLAIVLRDAPRLLRLADESEPLVASGPAESAQMRMTAAYLKHDPAGAAELFRAYLRQPGASAADFVELVARRARLSRAVELKDAVALRLSLAELQAARAKVPAPLLRQFDIFELPEMAIALASLGMAREAAELATPLPDDCYPCLRAKGWAALAAGDRTNARRYLAEAVRQGPSLPSATLDLARLTALQGDRDAAFALFAKAARLSPNWADPPRYWGDALARAGDAAAAATKYRQAITLAPRWGELRIVYGRVLWRARDRAAARRQWELADRLPLGDRLRAQLAPLLGMARGGAK